MKSLNIKYIIWSNSEGTLTKCRVRDYTTTHVSQGNRFITRGMTHREDIVVKLNNIQNTNHSLSPTTKQQRKKIQKNLKNIKQYNAKQKYYAMKQY